MQHFSNYYDSLEKQAKVDEQGRIHIPSPQFPNATKLNTPHKVHTGVAILNAVDRTDFSTTANTLLDRAIERLDEIDATPEIVAEEMAGFKRTDGMSLVVDQEEDYEPTLRAAKISSFVSTATVWALAEKTKVLNALLENDELWNALNTSLPTASDNTSKLPKRKQPFVSPNNLGTVQYSAGRPITGAATNVSVDFRKMTAGSDPVLLGNEDAYKQVGIINDPSSAGRNQKLTSMHAVRGKFGGGSYINNMFLGTSKSNNFHADSHYFKVESQIEYRINEFSKLGSQNVIQNDWYVHYQVIPDYAHTAQSVIHAIDNTHWSTLQDKNDAIQWASNAAPSKYQTFWELRYKLSNGEEYALGPGVETHSAEVGS